MTAYLAILSARFRTLLQYRAAAAAGFGTQLFWGLIRVMIFAGFYASTSAPQPLTYEEVVDYVWLGQATLVLLLTGVDNDVRTMIRTGSVAYELVRPMDLYGLWFARAVAARTAPLLLRAIPMFVVAGLFVGLDAPASPAAGLAWFLATVGAVLLSAALWTLATITLLWTISGEGVVRLMPAAAYILSGSLVPLPLLPGWARSILEFLPFRHLQDVPFRLYMGDLPLAGLPGLMAHQVLWIAALVLAGRLLLARGVRRLVVQGG